MSRQETMKRLVEAAELAPDVVLEETLDFMQFLLARQPQMRQTVLHDLLQLREAGMSDLLSADDHELGLHLIDTTTAPL